MRAKSMLDQAVGLIEAQLEEPEFRGKLSSEPKVMMELLDRMERLAKLQGGGEEFKKTLSQLCAASPGSVLVMVGKMNRNRLRKALDEWEEE